MHWPCLCIRDASNVSISLSRPDIATTVSSPTAKLLRHALHAWEALRQVHPLKMQIHTKGDAACPYGLFWYGFASRFGPMLTEPFPLIQKTTYKSIPSLRSHILGTLLGPENPYQPILYFYINCICMPSVLLHHLSVFIDSIYFKLCRFSWRYSFICSIP